MNAPASQHVLQARDLIGMLQIHPDYAYVVIDFDQGDNQCRAFIDRVVWHQGKIELKCLFDGDLKTVREEELEDELGEVENERSKFRTLLEQFKDAVRESHGEELNDLANEAADLLA